VTTAAAVLILFGVLAFAVVRPFGLSEVVAAAPAALLVLAMGLVPWRDVGAEIAALGPTVGFLAAVLVLSTSRTNAECSAISVRWRAG
jgi:arsenical pump membrane protein